MRPYLAILRDSIREATASRTLPFVLLFFTVALLALAPIGLQQDVPWRLALDEIADQTLLLAKIRQQSQLEGDNPGKRLLERLPEHATSQLGLNKTPGAVPPGAAFILTNAINSDVLPDRTFYSEEAWKDLPLHSETQDLIKRGPAKLPEDDLKRLNRLLLSAAYPGALKTPSDSRARITYFGFEIPGLSGQMEQLFSETDMVRRIIREVIYAICVWIIGPIGLLIGIIVTAEIMPRTFEPGAIDLLLSKPVNRALVLLTKFLGACAFILISFTYLVVGLWLIFWLRLDVFAPQLLGAIPLFVFSFTVIYAVSAVVGMLWRSPIVSVMVAVLVWGGAFGLGFTRDIIENVVRADDRVRQITLAGDALVVADFGRTAYVWSEKDEDWQELPDLMPLLSPNAAANPLLLPKVLGPLYDAPNGRLVVAESGAVGDNVLRFGSPTSTGKSKEGAKLPPGTEQLFITKDGRYLAAGRAGLYEFRGDPTVQKKEFMIFGILDLVPEDASNTFARVDDGKGGWGEGVTADIDSTGQTALVYESGLLKVLRRNEKGRFETVAETRLANAVKAQPAIVAIAPSHAVVALKDGTIRLFDVEKLKELASARPMGEEVPQSAVVSPDGRYLAVLFHSGDVWIRDLEAAAGDDGVVGGPSGQGDISAIAFDPQGRLLTADRLRRVTRHTIPALDVEERYDGSLPTSEKIYRYGLTPLSFLLPDTYGLRSVYQYLFTDLKSESTTINEQDLESRHIRLELRRPILQNLGFLAVVLGLASLYVIRKDF